MMGLIMPLLGNGLSVQHNCKLAYVLEGLYMEITKRKIVSICLISNLKYLVSLRLIEINM